MIDFDPSNSTRIIQMCVLALCFLINHSLSDTIMQKVDWTSVNTNNHGFMNTKANSVATAQDAFFKGQK